MEWYKVFIILTIYDQNTLITFEFQHLSFVSSQLPNVSIFALQGFMADCPDGRMDREKMKVMFKAIMPEGDAGEVFLDQLFRIFDKDGDGSIDFKVGRQVQ